MLRWFCKESYNDPEALYETLKSQGMDLVTVTDHDSIGSCESLRKYPDFFVSEEVTCLTPTGTRFHLGVYDITDRDHIELQRRRADFWSLMAYLRERQLLFAINHPFSSLTGRRSRLDFLLFQDLFPAVEVHNGHMLESANRLAREFQRTHGKAGLGGSDAHAILSVGSAYTEVPQARTKQEFFDGIRAGLAETRGSHGSWARLTAEVLWIGLSMGLAQPWLLPVSIAGAPLAGLLTLGNYFKELQFARTWSRTLGSVGPVVPPAKTLIPEPEPADETFVEVG